MACMAADSLLYILLLLTLIALFGFLSLIEVSFSYLNGFKLVHRMEKEEVKTRKIVQLLDHKGLFVSGIMWGKTLSMVGALLLAILLSLEWIGYVSAILASTLAVVLALKGIEYAAKTISLKRGEDIAYSAIGWVYPLVRLGNRLAFRKDKKEDETMFFNAEEFDAMISFGIKHNILGEEKTAQLEKALVHHHNTVKTAMKTHRTNIVGIEMSSSLEKVKSVVASHDYDCFPVYNGNLDHIVGVLSKEDLNNITDGSTFSVEAIMRDKCSLIHIVNSMPCGVVLRRMRSSRVYFAVILDEYGGTEGIVTMEDILEKIT